MVADSPGTRAAPAKPFREFHKISPRSAHDWRPKFCNCKLFARSYVRSTEAGPGWRRARGAVSLQEVFGSVATRPTGSTAKKLIAFLGPGYLVAVGYMDPGNWATSLAGGSKFGYSLLTVALMSNIMAIVLQALCARLGIGAGRDLAQACRDAYPAWVSRPLWLLAELAICATDLAEVIGTAIGLNLLFGIPLELGVLITALDVFLILWLQCRSPWRIRIGARSSADLRRRPTSSRTRTCSISRSASWARP